jgi:hypothetical protein
MNKKSKKKSANGGLDAVYLRQANANPRYWRGADRLKDGAGSRCSGSRSPDRNPAQPAARPETATEKGRTRDAFALSFK